ARSLEAPGRQGLGQGGDQRVEQRAARTVAPRLSRLGGPHRLTTRRVPPRRGAHHSLLLTTLMVVRAVDGRSNGSGTVCRLGHCVFSPVFSRRVPPPGLSVAGRRGPPTPCQSNSG